MTPNDLLALCDEAEQNNPNDAVIVLKLNRTCNGKTAKIGGGLVGTVLQHGKKNTPGWPSVVCFEVKAVRAYVDALRAQEARP